MHPLTPYKKHVFALFLLQNSGIYYIIAASGYYTLFKLRRFLAAQRQPKTMRNYIITLCFYDIIAASGYYILFKLRRFLAAQRQPKTMRNYIITLRFYDIISRKHLLQPVEKLKTADFIDKLINTDHNWRNIFESI